MSMCGHTDPPIVSGCNMGDCLSVAVETIARNGSNAQDIIVVDSGSGVCQPEADLVVGVWTTRGVNSIG